MTRIHGLQHVEGFLAAAFADDDAVRPHSQRVFYEVALANFPLPLGIQGTRFQAAHMRLLQLELGRVLDCDQALVRRNIIRERVEERRLAGAGSSRHHDGYLSTYRRAKRLGDLWPNRADFDKLVHRKGPLREFSNGNQRPIDSNRLDGNIDARPVGQTRVDHGR